MKYSIQLRRAAISGPDFDAALLETLSPVCGPLFQWIRNVVSLAQVYQKALPLREKLRSLRVLEEAGGKDVQVKEVERERALEALQELQSSFLKAAEVKSYLQGELQDIERRMLTVSRVVVSMSSPRSMVGGCEKTFVITRAPDAASVLLIDSERVVLAWAKQV